MPDEAFAVKPGDQTWPEWQLRNRGKKKSNGIAPPSATKTPQIADAATKSPVKHQDVTATSKVRIPAAGAATEKKETPSLVPRKPATQKPESTPAQEKEVQNEPFDDLQVEETWTAYKEDRLSRGATDTEKLVLNRKLRKSGEHNVKIYLESQLEISILEKFEAEMVGFFRKSLNNTLIQVEKEVSEQDTSKQLYTSKEKFEYMAKQNPALKLLKDRLGLDFEY